MKGKRQRKQACEQKLLCRYPITVKQFGPAIQNKDKGYHNNDNINAAQLLPPLPAMDISIIEET